MATPDEETPGITPYSDTDNMSGQESGALPIMTGWCHKKGKFGFRLRYYTLSADGKLYAAKDDQTTEKKHILDMGECTSLELAHKADLIIKGHNAKGRLVSITLRFNEPEERDEWVGAFNKFIRKEGEMIGQSVDKQLAPTLFRADEMLRVRSNLNGIEVTEQQIIVMMWELQLTPRSVPMTAKGETLLGAGKAQVSLRHYANEFGTDAAKRLMVYEDPVQVVQEAAVRQ